MTDKMADQIFKELEQSNRLVAELVQKSQIGTGTYGMITIVGVIL